MKYMGSKARFAKQIYSVMDSVVDISKYSRYVEPFVGGGNSMAVASSTFERSGYDTNHYVIALLDAVANKNWSPPDVVTEAEYQDVRLNKNSYSDEYVGFVGIGCSYSGKWFGGYARGNAANGTPRNYCAESKRNILKQASLLRGVHFETQSYENLHISQDSLVYCDPPYANTTKYAHSFDSEHFWGWCTELSLQSIPVFVSEYVAPADWTSVWQQSTTSSLTKDTGSKAGVEKLFVHNNLLKKVSNA